MRHLFVVTHPEATHHKADLVGGWHDSTLTSTGVSQAEKLAKRIQSQILHTTRDDFPLPIYITTSDLARCSSTAYIIAKRLGDIAYTRTPNLREISYGEAEGKPQSWLDERYIFPPADGNRLDHDCGIKGAETRRQVAERVYKAMNEIILPNFEKEDKEGKYKDVYQIVVTHGFALTFVIAAWIGMPLESAGLVGVQSTSGGITYLKQDDKFHNRSIVSVNETSHLE